ncbi:MAG TPA: hypothetical protein VED83_05095, partial [Burkholderiaceae bacterium]|nr:hypothetical protein [Burkholderiaceae bacterium]
RFVRRAVLYAAQAIGVQDASGQAVFHGKWLWRCTVAIVCARARLSSLVAVATTARLILWQVA